MTNEPQSQRIPIEACSPQPPPRPMRVLLADDDLELLGLLAEILRRDGYVVIEVSDGVELLRLSTAEQLEANEIDVIISDVLTPGASGMSMLVQLNQMVSPPLVIINTRCGEPDFQAWAQQRGAVAMFDKPFDLDELRTLLSSLHRSSLANPPRDGLSRR